MKIACPNCNASGNIPEHDIPLEGRFLSCPRCHHGFTVLKPHTSAESFMVDTCPACNFSTFGEDRFDTCPKCGVVVKAYNDRQREEMQRLREIELLNKKHTRDEPSAEPIPETSIVAEFVDNLHPVKLIGWGCGAGALLILGLGISGLLDYNTASIKEQILAQRDEQVSTIYVFLHYGLLPWIKTLYGITALVTVYYFLQYKSSGLKVLSILLKLLMAFVPLYLVISFISWILQPIPHSIGGYFIELVNIIFMTTLFCVPLYVLDRFLKDRRIVAVVRL